MRRPYTNPISIMVVITFCSLHWQLRSYQASDRLCAGEQKAQLSKMLNDVLGYASAIVSHIDGSAFMLVVEAVLVLEPKALQDHLQACF